MSWMVSPYVIAMPRFSSLRAAFDKRSVSSAAWNSVCARRCASCNSRAWRDETDIALAATSPTESGVADFDITLF